MKAMISQPRYLPCLGYLRRIQEADVFIVLDNVQRVSRGFENRNKVMSPSGEPVWLTIPVESSSRCLIKDTMISDVDWRSDHIRKLKAYYHADDLKFASTGLTGYFDAMASRSYLQSITDSIKTLQCKVKSPTFVFASDLSNTVNGGYEELLRLTKMAGCDTYLTGATCLEYGLTHEKAAESGVSLEIDRWTPQIYGDQRDYLSFAHFLLR